MPVRLVSTATVGALLVTLGWLSLRAEDQTGAGPSGRKRIRITLKLEAELIIETEKSSEAAVAPPPMPRPQPQPVTPQVRPEPAPQPEPGSRPIEIVPTPAQGNADPTRHALLIGCTRYPGLEVRGSSGAVTKSYDLRGPANDAPLVKKLLVEQYSFPAANIVTLVETADEDHRPTRDHIIREFQSLATRAEAGHRIVIAFSGHGAQEPDLDRDLAKDFEPDGLDEILLPSDSGRYDPQTKTVRNALIDDEIGVLLKAITAKKASVCIIIDACQSGSATRGELETARIVPMDETGLGIPGDVLQDAENWAAQQVAGARGVNEPTARGSFVDNVIPGAQPQARLAAVYAAQPTEPTIELVLPPYTEPGDVAERRIQGLLTFVLYRVLSTAKSPVTYHDLPGLLYSQYQIWGRNSPTPLVEGGDVADIFLKDETLQRSPFVLKKQGNRLSVTGGALQALSSGSILAVFPPPGGAPSQAPLGYVQIAPGGTGYLESTVVPVASPQGAPAVSRDRLPVNGECRVIQRSFPPLSIRIAVESDLPEDQTDDPIRREIARLAALLKQLAANKTVPIELVEDPRQSRWLVRVNRDGAYLIATPALANTGEQAKNPKKYPVRAGGDSGPMLEQFFTTVGRAENLLRIASDTDLAGKDLDVGLAVYEKDANGDYLRDPSGKKRLLTLDRAKEVVIHDADEIEFQLRNLGREPFDVSLLYVDDDYTISPFFPNPGTTTNNTIQPSDGRSGTLLPLSFRMRVDSEGSEHFVIFAVKTRGGPAVDFGSFAQPSLAEAREVGGRGANALQTPLGQLLSQLMFQGQRGVIQMSEVDSLAARVIPIRVRTDRRGARP